MNNKRTISEQKALKRLGIPDFRYMTKEKVTKLVSMLPYMDPEVAKKALEQFPTFKEFAGNIVEQYKDIVNKVIDSNKDSQEHFYSTCSSIIDILQFELQKETLSPEERDNVENKIIKVAEMIGEKDRENKEFHLKLTKYFLAAGTALSLIAASLIGSNILQNIDFNDQESKEDDHETI